MTGKGGPRVAFFHGIIACRMAYSTTETELSGNMVSEEEGAAGFASSRSGSNFVKLTR